ncbi:MAG TPA: AAA family ATPase [Ktedonobacteraceae bacterium]|nr:AAA family ATPase [Ktedonobacteraceae bacterium]
MIILKHFIAEHFRLLRRIDLHFPQRGSILIQGPNEAGKSTLFEGIYFALYGEALSVDANKRGNPHLDELISYGERAATVTLTVTIGATELTVTRIIERGRGQRASLAVRRLGMPEDNTITNVASVNQRIVRELGQINSETLRNSFLIEQKSLGRLERLTGTEREETLRRLLGLEKFTRLAEQFKLTDEDEKALHESVEHLRLAELQARIPEVSAQLGETEAALDAVAVTEALAAIDQQEAEIGEQQGALEQLEIQRNEIKGRQSRIKQLKKANETLGQIIAAYDSIAEAQREIPDLERQITELERREREELPSLEQRVRELSELAKSFGTLEHMAADLLTVVNTIKELEQEVREHEHIQETLTDLDGQIAHAQLLVDESLQSQNEVEEQNRSGRPKLEARLQRLRALAEKLRALQQAEAQRLQTLAQNDQAEENGVALRRVWRELQDSEKELELVEREARQVQQRADAVEQRWRKINIRRQLVEWQRLKALSQGLADAEHHLQAAHMRQEKLTIAENDAKSARNRSVGVLAAGVVSIFVLAIVAIVVFLNNLPTVGAVSMIAMLGAIALSVFLGRRWRAASQAYAEAHTATQEGMNSVSMMVAARQAAVRMGGNHEALAQIEREITSLGGSIPGSVEEAQHILSMHPETEESIAELQQRLNESRDEAQAARNQVNVTMEAVAGLRKEYTRLQDQRRQEDWDVIDEKLRSIQSRIEQLRGEIVIAAGQEGLPIPVGEITTGTGQHPTSSANVANEAELKVHIDDSIRATEREIAILEGKMGVVPDLEAQVKIHRDALGILLARRKALVERHEQFQASAPLQRMERAREQQTALREALRSLQDTLRLRVQPLGVTFGQTAITTAESTARRQLEALHVALGNKEDLQTRHQTYSEHLKEQQASLADHYRQLAKFSGSLGAWIVPPNPFAEVLVKLRLRCERELQEANEPSIQDELEDLKNQEGALNVRIALCVQEIEETQERIAAVLAQRTRPTPRGYTRAEVVAVWPLVGEHSPADRERLELRQAELEGELHRLEEQELELSQQLQTGGRKLDLEEARQRMERQERNYQTKKRGSLMLQATTDRLMRKMLPRIEYYMQQFLPVLTVGRYHDIRLFTEADEQAPSGGPLQLSVWEPAASEYIPRNALSGGTADQISLTLRLAFAVASLPRELSAAPGFLLLDEPLTSSSRERMQALVDIMTGEVLGQHFEQVLFISHNTAFDPAMFNHHIYVDNGQVSESTLPAGEAFAPATPLGQTMTTPLPDTADLEALPASDDDDGTSTAKVPIALPIIE